MASGASLAIVDDHRLLSQGLAAALESRGLSLPVTIDPNSVDVLVALAEHQPDIVLLDVNFGENTHAGLSLIEEICTNGIRVIMFTGINDPALFGRCIDLGAETVIRKSTSLDDVTDCLVLAISGQEIGNDAEKFSWYKAHRDAKLERSRNLKPFESLTPKESSVLDALVDGLTADEIAELGFVSLSTVRSQVRSIFRKLNVHSQVAAVALVRRSDWQSHPEDQIC